MFAKILIANRGEIACRVIRTARGMGIRTVAVYSDADAAALHVRQADEAIAIGGSTPADSYLNVEKVIAACRTSGAEAVHPGYGFLSEREAFANAVASIGVVFIGPTSQAIAAMGDKIESKRLAATAGVPTVPGCLDVISDVATAAMIANEIGYPVMIKASAGGGGKGMRLVRHENELVDAFRAAANEARSAFGDERVFIEKAITRPRHIEIQVLGDNHGNILHFGERECSIQRRHQKVVEEAPSPFLDEATRHAMGTQAVALARAVKYRSAGTVEFIVDEERNFYFLEMNTRLQVEHPVTEEVTGVDLVELMIRVAAGERLPMTQEQISLRGSAIEARVYAEDPVNGFLPSIGRLTRYQEPSNDGIRVDAGVCEGADISIYYDPMIAKVVALAETRPEAIARMSAALDGFVIRGVNHNIDFLSAIMTRPRFAEGKLSTDFITEEFHCGFEPTQPSADNLRVMMCALAAVTQRLDCRDNPSDTEYRDLALIVGDSWSESRPLTISQTPNGDSLVVSCDGWSRIVATGWQPGAVLWRGTIDGISATVQLDRRGSGWRVRRAGAVVDMRVLSGRVGQLARFIPVRLNRCALNAVPSPMPGLVVSISVRAGQLVKKGDVVAVVEAMKMENIIRADRDGVVGKIVASPGQSVSVGEVLIEFT
jgi:propionyl-CoA carboxylase alpha chain